MASMRNRLLVGSAFWSGLWSGAGYALVGALPRERLLALAQAIYKQGLPGTETP